MVMVIVIVKVVVAMRFRDVAAANGGKTPRSPSIPQKESEAPLDRTERPFWS